MTNGYEVSAQDRFYEWLLSDHPDYRYPAHLTGASAGGYPPPPEPEPEAGP